MIERDSMEPGMESHQDIHELQQEDKAVGPVLEAIEAAKKLSPDDIAGKERD